MLLIYLQQELYVRSLETNIETIFCSDELLLAAGAEVQQSPGGPGVELCLVPAECPHVGDPQHLNTLFRALFSGY